MSAHDARVSAEFKWTTHIDSGIRDLLEADVDLGTTVHSEMLDGKHFTDSAYLVHEHLYESSSLSRINMRDYLNDLVSTVAHSMDLSAGRITVISKVEEFPLDLDQAIPLGLIINELLSNAFKYAYSDTAGTVGLSLEQREGDVHLEVSDSGPGIVGEVEAHRDSLGLQLVEALSGQLGGSVRFENTRPGLSVRV
ncbi:MAG: sensor histidine kinase, partial [Spirochaetaceae bacterium]